MTVKEWLGIPERYWPSSETPWRVSWGIGVFQDFATRDEAQKFYDELKASEPDDWAGLVNEPWNAYKGR